MRHTDDDGGLPLALTPRSPGRLKIAPVLSGCSTYTLRGSGTAWSLRLSDATRHDDRVLFQRGHTILRREVLHEQSWLEFPVCVVSDTDELLAVLLEPGSTFTFPEHPVPHPWMGNSSWTGKIVLQLQRPGDAYAAWKFFDPGGHFMHWYINFEMPIVKHVDVTGGGCYDTADYGIDIVIHPGGSGLGKITTTRGSW